MREVKITVCDQEKPCCIRLILRTLFHIAASCICYFVAMYGAYIAMTVSEKVLENEFLRDMHKLTPFFFTNWNYMFQTIFLSISLLYDVLEWLDKHQTEFGKRLARYRDIMFCGMVVPFTMFISTMFWTVYLIDRELVFPEVYDQIVPWWFNHCVHTNIAIVVLIETILQARRHPTNMKIELSLVSFVGVLYAIVYYAIYFLTHRWLYAIFGIMTWWQVCLYQLAIWGSTFLFYYIQFPINRIFHREADSLELEKTDVKVNGTREFQ